MRPSTTTHDSLAGSPSVDSTTRFHQVLIILFSIYFLGGSSSDPLADRVEDAVSDAGRSARAVATANRIELRRESMLHEIIAWHEGFYETLRKQDAAEPAVFGELQRLIFTIEEAEHELLDLRFELRSELTADEWSELWD